MVTAAMVRAALFAISAVAATISPLASIAPAATPVPIAIASVTGLVTGAPTFAFSVRRVLCASLSFDALLVGVRLRDALAALETVFLEGLARLAVARPADAAVFRDIFLRDAAVLEIVFLGELARFPAVRPFDAAVFRDVLLPAVLDPAFLEVAVFFAAARPRAFVPRPDLEALFFGELAIHNSLAVDLSARSARHF